MSHEAAARPDQTKTAELAEELLHIFNVQKSLNKNQKKVQTYKLFSECASFSLSPRHRCTYVSRSWSGNPNFWRNQVLCRPSGGGPRLDRWARIQSGRVNFGVFSTSRFVPSALSSDFFTTMYFSPTLLRFFTYFSLTFSFFLCTFGVDTFERISIFGKQYP